MRQGRARLVGLAAAAGAATVLAGGCTSNDPVPTALSSDASPPGRQSLELRAVVLPDLSHMAASVQAQLHEEYSSLMLAVDNPRTTPAEIGDAYGRLGNLLMATQYRDLAEACFLNAQALAPNERRWPYYLGHLSRIRGAFARSATFFEQALQLRPDDVPTLVWLGEVHLAQGRPEAAESLFARALVHRPGSVSARVGLGRAALATQEYARAVQYLEEALALDERATSAHYPLAMAYRGLGELEKADAHLRQRGDLQILPADPLMAAADVVLRSPLAYERRGTQALDSGDWAGAAAYFRQGIELAPANASLRQKLGMALFMTEDARGAGEQFEEALRLVPDYAKALYGLGVLLAARGDDPEAIDRFSAAVQADPDYVEARLWLAGVLRRSGRPDEALAHYEQVISIDPRVGGATFGYAATLVGLRRYQEARDRLAHLVAVYPDQPLFAHALARLLVAAPDARVRDGLEAMAVLDALVEEQRITDFGETLAMTLAELEYYEDAASWLREGIAAARRAGREDLIPRMAEKLGQYERGQPWRDDEPLGLDPLMALSPF